MRRPAPGLRLPGHRHQGNASTRVNACCASTAWCSTTMTTPARPGQERASAVKSRSADSDQHPGLLHSHHPLPPARPRKESTHDLADRSELPQARPAATPAAQPGFGCRDHDHLWPWANPSGRGGPPAPGWLRPGSRRHRRLDSRRPWPLVGEAIIGWWFGWACKSSSGWTANPMRRRGPGGAACTDEPA